VGDLLVDMELEWKGLKMMGHSWDGQQVLWHSTVLYRLRFISFVAESFWSLAFKERRGLNQLDASSVSSVVLSDVEVGGKSYGRRKFAVAKADSDIAHAIAVEVVRQLEGCNCRILDAIVPASRHPGEHDLVVERPGLKKPSSVEVKCRTILKPKELLEQVRGQIRRESLKLRCPDQFAERIVVLVEYGTRTLEDGWRHVRIEKYDSSGWKSLVGWQGAQEVPITMKPRAAPSGLALSNKSNRGIKRKRDNAGAAPSNDGFVYVAGERYTTLPKYLGREAVKSEKTLALKSCSDDRVELRRGDWTSLSGHWGQELVERGDKVKFLNVSWVDTCVLNPRPERHPLQVKLLKVNQEPGTHKFLWCLSHLEKCRSLKK